MSGEMGPDGTCVILARCYAERVRAATMTRATPPLIPAVALRLAGLLR